MVETIQLGGAVLGGWLSAMGEENSGYGFREILPSQEVMERFQGKEREKLKAGKTYIQWEDRKWWICFPVSWGIGRKNIPICKGKPKNIGSTHLFLPIITHRDQKHQETHYVVGPKYDHVLCPRKYEIVMAQRTLQMWLRLSNLRWGQDRGRQQCPQTSRWNPKCKYSKDQIRLPSVGWGPEVSKRRAQGPPPPVAQGHINSFNLHTSFWEEERKLNDQSKAYICHKTVKCLQWESCYLQ